MSDLLSKIMKVKKWKESQRVEKSPARVSLSEDRIVFFTAKTEKSGTFSCVLDLGHSNFSGLEKEMEKNLNHIEKIWQKYTKNKEEK